MSVNKAILIGRLGRDPETRYTSSGQPVCNFTLATDETFKDGKGERQKRTEWHRITVWGEQAEIAQQYLHKGSLIYLEGRIQTRQWDDREGQKRTTVEIVATNFRMLGSRSDDSAATAGAGSGVEAEVQAPTPVAERASGTSRSEQSQMSSRMTFAPAPLPEPETRYTPRRGNPGGRVR